MAEVLALVRARWLTASSYRFRMLLSLGSFGFVIVPVFFIAGALQPMMAESIRAEGGDYFGFVLLGMIALAVVTAAVTLLPAEIGTGIGNGTLEAMLSTPVRMPVLFAGMIGFGLVWAAAREILMLGTGWLLGAPVAWSGLPAAALILGLIFACHLPIGMFAAASMIVFRTTGPVPVGVVFASGLLGGVYYPTHVVPSWLNALTQMVPLTYGVRALRQVLLDAQPLTAVARDVFTLCAFGAALGILATLTFAAALRYARRAATLTHY